MGRAASSWWTAPSPATASSLVGNSPSGWPCHGMEHALSAYYDITHGEGLAILTPRWMRHILNPETTRERFVQFRHSHF